MAPDDFEWICPGCTCDNGRNCDVYLNFGEMKHWFIHEHDDGTFECDFCNLVIDFNPYEEEL